VAIQSIRNQYPGINAHLHSYWQAESGWPEFHSRYLIHLTDTLKPLLLKMGYTAAIESSLQIRRVDWPGEFTTPYHRALAEALYGLEQVDYGA
jgi:hypothetical protein